MQHGHTLVIGRYYAIINNFPLAPALLKFGSGDGPVVYSYVNCMGFEKSLSLCSKTQYPSVTLFC